MTYADGLYPLRTDTLSILDAIIAGRTPALTPAKVTGVGAVSKLDAKPDSAPSAPSGLTKKQQAVWSWLSEHNAEVTHDLPAARFVSERTNVSKSVCASVLKMYREFRG